MGDVAIKVEGLGKKYTIGHQKSGDLRNSFADRIKGMLSRKGLSVKEDFWALQDINFEIKKGEALGVIGRNGAGKSTLLKILNRITEPTKGRFEINGRVSSLLEVGTGFHPELTGRENIYLNGTILGMKRREIKAKFDEIVAFSGVEKFIDTQVKHYSSGMKVRLAFSVAAHLEPEILIVDEVLAVGDAEFQKKCLGKMDEVSKHEGRTIVFVSHNMGAITSLCDSGLLLINGSLKMTGSIDQVITHYLKPENHRVVDLSERYVNKVKPVAYFTSAKVLDKHGRSTDITMSGEPVSIELGYKADPSLKLNFFIGVYSALGEKILHLGSVYSSKRMIAMFAEEGRAVCNFDKLPLPEGVYFFNLSLDVGPEALDHVTNAFQLQVEKGDFFGTGEMPPGSINKVLIDQTWLFKDGLREGPPQVQGINKHL